MLGYHPTIFIFYNSFSDRLNCISMLFLCIQQSENRIMWSAKVKGKLISLESVGQDFSNALKVLGVGKQFHQPQESLDLIPVVLL